ncbi:MAG: inositol monophosphatase [Candidatus Parcubacteria bacterium]|nr:inositol monophosphatase [Candidatus Parcubacteria bacterium]
MVYSNNSRSEIRRSNATMLRRRIKTEIAVLIKKTGGELLKIFKSGKKNHLKFKSKHEIATSADFLAEKIILKRIRALTPDWHIISEEKGDDQKKSDYLWTVDPLDGTTNFYMGNPLFAVQIALLYKKEPILAWIYAPAIDEYYFAQKNKGAYLNNKKIRVSKNILKHALLTYCHGSQETQLKQALKLYQHFKLRSFDIRQIGSAALEFGWVAKGRTDCYISPSANPWDICPGVLLVKEATGTVSDFKGKAWHLGAKNVFASNGVIDKIILNYLRKM